MGCANVKCSNPSCQTYMRQCQMIQGMCPTCYLNRNNVTNNQTTTNAVNSTLIVNQQPKQ